ncbi:NUDIX domain-containing protein [Kitasatospora indigofera]|uniref:NUDIX domain-containing protein n=1 Tax=Kitasatospora indigofera TaxID=67307 RepID=UPI003674F9F4
MTTTADTAPVRTRVCAALLYDGHVALIRRERPAGVQYSLPGGLVEAGEDPLAALRRELLEELGLDLDGLPVVPRLRFTQDQATPRPGESGLFRRRHLVFTAHLPDHLHRTVAATEQDDPDRAPVLWLPLAAAAALHLYRRRPRPPPGPADRPRDSRRPAAAPRDDRGHLSVALTFRPAGAEVGPRRLACVTQPPQPPLPSLDLLLQVVTKERDELRAHFESLDTKASIVLAFDGVLIPLAVNAEPGFRIASVSLNVISAVFALIAYWPRKFPVLHVDDALRNYLTWPADDTRLVLHDTTMLMIKQARPLLSDKGRNLKVALVVLFTAALVFGAGVLFAASSGSDDDRPKPGPSAVLTPTALGGDASDAHRSASASAVAG